MGVLRKLELRMVLVGLALSLSLSATFTGCQSESELQRRYERGRQDGKREGYTEGYDEGYNDGANGRPKRFTSESQNWYLNATVYVAALLSIMVLVYWAVYIYGSFDNRDDVLSQMNQESFYDGSGLKLLISAVTVTLALLLMPGNYLTRLSLYLHAKLAHQSLVLTAGALVGFLVAFFICKSIVVESGKQKLVSQCIWAGLFPCIVYEMISSFISVQGWDVDFANETLMFQAGMLGGLLTLLTVQQLAKTIFEAIQYHKSIMGRIRQLAQ